MLDELLSSLPEDNVVFIVIDSLSCLSGSQGDGDKVIRRLKRVVKNRPDIVIKVMMTAAFANSRVKRLADISLFVQNLVAGFGAIDIVETNDENFKKLICNQVAKQKGKRVVLEAEDEDSGSDDVTEEDENEDDDTDMDGYLDNNK
ncbi:hypothetical protein F4776DRAFT_631217 [Hypoxylon sp. NC0597]|nr:hypothetical protein F4776DRAFT_631217 [Hypoxylon sp. NC0597]